MSVKFTAVMPYVYEPYKRACLANVHPLIQEQLLLVDNTVNNVGIMKAHNMGIEKMRAEDTDWLIVMSAAVRFGEPCGMDFIKALEDRPGDLVVEAAGVYGWHLIAFSRECIERVGKWDENFTPYGYDDLDYAYRIGLTFGDDKRNTLWQKAEVDVEDAGMAHGIKKRGIEGDENFLRSYYKAKWGGMTGEEYYKNPWNNENTPVWYWPPAKNGSTCEL